MPRYIDQETKKFISKAEAESRDMENIKILYSAKEKNKLGIENYEDVKEIKKLGRPKGSTKKKKEEQEKEKKEVKVIKESKGEKNDLDDTIDLSEEIEFNDEKDHSDILDSEEYSWLPKDADGTPSFIPDKLRHLIKKEDPDDLEVGEEAYTQGIWKCSVEKCKHTFDTPNGLLMHLKSFHNLKNEEIINLLQGTILKSSEEVKLPKKKYTFTARQGIKLTPEAQIYARDLLRFGNYRDFNDLINRALTNSYLNSIGKEGNKMNGSNEIVKQMEEARLNKKLLDIYSQDENSGNMDVDKLIDQHLKEMQKMQKLKMLEKMQGGSGGGSGFNMDAIMQMMVMQMLKENMGGANKIHPEIQSLKAEISALRDKEREEKFQNLVKMATESKRDDKDSAISLLAEIRRIESQKDVQIKEQESKYHTEQLKRMEDQNAYMREEFERRIGNNAQDPITSKLREKIEERLTEKFSNPDMLFGKKEEKEEKMDIKEIIKTIGEVAKPLMEPIGARVGDALANRMSGNKGRAYEPEDFEDYEEVEPVVQQQSPQMMQNKSPIIIDQPSEEESNKQQINEPVNTFGLMDLDPNINENELDLYNA